jgi:hypothetical protein
MRAQKKKVIVVKDENEKCEKTRKGRRRETKN